MSKKISDYVFKNKPLLYISLIHHSPFLQFNNKIIIIKSLCLHH